MSLLTQLMAVERQRELRLAAADRRHPAPGRVGRRLRRRPATAATERGTDGRLAARPFGS